MEKSGYLINDIHFVPQDRTLVFDQCRAVLLSHRESLILRYFLDNPNKAITLTELIQQGLNQYPSELFVIRQAVNNLSIKLEKAGVIEQPYLDCYLFRSQCGLTQQSRRLSLNSIKQLFRRKAATTIQYDHGTIAAD